MSVALEGITDPYDVVLGTNFGIVEWGSGFIGVIGSASQVDDKVDNETPEKELERKGRSSGSPCTISTSYRC